MKSSIWFSVILLLSCSAYGEKMSFDGKLIYGGQGIYSLDLSGGESALIKALPSLSVNEVSKVDSRSLLVSSFNLLPSEERSTISIYEFQSSVLKTLLVGSRGVYIPTYKKIVFYDRKARLSIANIDGDFKSIEVIDTDANAYPMSVVPISKNEFLYESKRGGAHGIWMYDFESGEATELIGLKTCSLNYAIWRSQTNELLCSEKLENGRYTGGYFLTDLNGDNRQYVNFGDGKSWPVIYIDSLDALVLQERAASLFTGEFYPVYIYRFSEGLKTEISEDNMLSRRIVYLEDLVDAR